MCLVSMIVCMEWMMTRIYWLTPEKDASQIELKQAKFAVLQTKEDFDVLFFGDSTAGNDIIPALFTSLTGLRSYSVHTNSNVSPTANVYLLSEYLKHHRAPKIVILSQTLFAWSIPQHHDIILEHFMRPDIGWMLWRNGIVSTEEFLESLTTHWLPSLAYRRHFQRLRESGNAFDGILGMGEGQYEDDMRGHIPVLRDISQSDAYEGEMHAVAKLLRDAPTKPNLGFSDEALFMTRAFCSLAKEHNIFAAIVIPPLPSPVLSQAGAFTGLTLMQMRIINEVEGSGCRLMNTIEMSPNLFGDGVHVNETGATFFTQKLATLVQKSMMRQ